MSRQPRDRGTRRRFSRGSYWNRPALSLLGAVFLCGLGVFFLADVPQGVADAIGMSDPSKCSAPGRPRCLERVTAEVDGPVDRSLFDREWRLVRTGPDGRQWVGHADISVLGSRKLDDGDRVEVLKWGGEVVAVDTAAGERIETEDYGHGRWISPLVLGLGSFGWAVVAVQSARGKRLAAEGWWSTSSESSGFAPPAALTATGVVLAFGPLFALVAMDVGARAVTAGMIGLAATATLIALAVWLLTPSGEARP